MIAHCGARFAALEQEIISRVCRQIWSNHLQERLKGIRPPQRRRQDLPGRDAIIRLVVVLAEQNDEWTSPPLQELEILAVGHKRPNLKQLRLE
jgi:transposase-like protein